MQPSKSEQFPFCKVDAQQQTTIHEIVALKKERTETDWNAPPWNHRRVWLDLFLSSTKGVAQYEMTHGCHDWCHGVDERVRGDLIPVGQTMTLYDVSQERVRESACSIDTNKKDETDDDAFE